MRFTKKSSNWSSPIYKGVKNKFEFSYQYQKDWKAFSILVMHKTKDIRYNTAWSDYRPTSKEEVEKWCENFDYTKYQCIGKDVEQ